MPFRSFWRHATVLILAVVAVPAAIAIAASSSDVTRVKGRLAISTSNIHIKRCAGGFDASADARIKVSSHNPRLAGTMNLKLKEIASSADDAYVVASGTFFNSRTKARKGTVKLTGVDHGNDLNGVYVITLDNGRGIIVGNTSSHQDSGTSAHGEIGADSPLKPSNSAVLVSAHC